MEKYILKFYSNFSNPDVYKKIYERLCETHLLDFYGPDKKVYITNGDDYTHIIILNTAMPNIPQHISKENVIGLSFEPNVYLGLNDRFINYVQKNVGKYFIGDASNLPKPFYEHYAYMMHITPLNYIPQKTKLMSIIFSEKQQQVGHKYRHILVSRILEEKLPIDISAIVREPNNQFVNSYIRRLRSKYSVKCYSKNKAGTKKLLSNFRNGNSLALLADQQLSSGIEMSFFKKKMKFSSLPAQLGLKYHCDIYLGWPIRKEDYSLSFEIIDCIKTQGLSQTNEEIQNITKKIIEFYELMIEKYPHQYFWLHDRWKIK